MVSPSNPNNPRRRRSPNAPQDALTDTQRPDNSGPGTTTPAEGSVGTVARTDEVTVPRIEGFSPTSSQTTRVSSEADLALEYIVSSGPRLASQFGTPYGLNQAAGIHVLPIYIDELERDFGTDMYLRMLNDATVKSVDGDLRASILDKPVQISSAVDDRTEKDEKRKALAQEVATFVQAVYDQLPGGINMALYELLEGIPLGYKLMEQVYEIREVVPGNGPQTALASLNPKPQEAVSIVVDQYNHVLGYMPRLAGSGLFGSFAFGDLGLRTTGSVDGATNRPTVEDVDIPNLVPPEKVLRFTWQPRNDDPRGTSHLRAAYVPWRLKIGLYPAYEAYLARFAQPSAALELNGADTPPMADIHGNVIKDPALIVLQLLNNLRNYQAGGAMVLPVGKASLLQATSNGQAYLSAFELVDEQITLCYLYANLSTQGGKYGTQALGEVHQDTKGLLVSYGKQVVENTLQQESVKPLVYYNYGEAGLQVLPKVSLGEGEQQDFATTAGALASLKGVELILPHQYNDIFKMLHLPLLPQDVIDLLIEKWEMMVKSEITLADPNDPNNPNNLENPNNPNSPNNPMNIQAEQSQPPSPEEESYY